MSGKRRLRRIGGRISSGAPPRAPAKTSPGRADADYAREFEQFLERFICREVNFISWASSHGDRRLHPDYAPIREVLPDSSRLTAFACDECGRPLVHQFKRGNRGYDFFGCSGCLEGCMALYDNKGGKPVPKV